LFLKAVLVLLLQSCQKNMSMSGGCKLVSAFPFGEGGGLTVIMLAPIRNNKAIHSKQETHNFFKNQIQNNFQVEPAAAQPK
jgi:hypothetical protein